MRRYWISPDDVRGNEVVFQGDVLHHIRDVCRLRTGDKFEVLWGDGKAYFVEIISESKRECRAIIREERAIAPLRKPLIHLALCIPRPAIMDAVVEKAVELGVATFTPVVSAQSFWKTQDEVISKKLERLERIVLSSTQQCGRAELMKIEAPENIQTMVEKMSSTNRSANSVGLFLYEGEGTRSVREALEKVPGGIEEIWVLIGGEGGFSSKEVEWISKHGLHPLTLGPQVLRVETACVATISVIKYQLGLMVE